MTVSLAKDCLFMFPIAQEGAVHHFFLSIEYIVKVQMNIILELLLLFCANFF